MRKPKITSVIFHLFIIIIFLFSSIQAKAEYVLKLEGLRSGNQENVYYILPSGEIVTPADGEVREIKDIEEVTRVDPYEVYLVQWNDQDFWFNRVKASREKAEKKTRIEFKRSDAFQKAQFLLPLLTVSSSKNTYYKALKDTSATVDNILTPKDIAPWPFELKCSYWERIGKPKLRPFLSYLSYRLCGGENEKAAMEIAALSELNNLGLYMHNDLMDDKRSEISADNRSCLLIAGGELLANMVIQEICASVYFNDEQKVQIISRYSADVATSYLGQIKNSELLTDELLPEEEFIEAYRQRCGYLSGSMYGFSTWLGAMASGKSNPQILETYYRLGYLIGSALQISNDLCDFSPLRKNAYNDIKHSKATAPIYYMAASHPDGLSGLKQMSEPELTSYLVSSDAYEKTLALARKDRNDAKRIIKTLPALPERAFLSESLAAVKSNQYLSSIKNHGVYNEKG